MLIYIYIFYIENKKNENMQRYQKQKSGFPQEIFPRGLHVLTKFEFLLAIGEEVVGEGVLKIVG
jgi:hypothetical protein